MCGIDYEPHTWTHTFWC